jgi:hypothetical protein
MHTTKGEVSRESSKVDSSLTLEVNAMLGISIELDFGGDHESNSDIFIIWFSSKGLNRLQTAQWGLMVDMYKLNFISSAKPSGEGPNVGGVYWRVFLDNSSNTNEL